ncbi:MAG: hypothetical protein H0X37_00950 [Herpetosiphonaceae bacterium]|nr:hypothetical protein [Herpetosiphonaceae bacterium]
MPRGTYYSEELREEARRLRREGFSLTEISVKLGPPRNTLLGWVQGIKLTMEQQARIAEKRRDVGFAKGARNIAAEKNKAARLARIEAERQKAEALLATLEQQHHANHIAAAMLYLGEESKGKDTFRFANSNENIIRYWLYLLRTSFGIDEAKFRITIFTRADQDLDEISQYWVSVTRIQRCLRVYVDARTEGKSSTYAGYKGVCAIDYYDVAIRRYLDALAQGLITQALGTGTRSDES